MFENFNWYELLALVITNLIALIVPSPIFQRAKHLLRKASEALEDGKITSDEIKDMRAEVKKFRKSIKK
jgi:hypothetical protein